MRNNRISKKIFVKYLLGKFSDEELSLRLKGSEKEKEQLIFIKHQLKSAQRKGLLSVDNAWKQVKQNIRPQKKLPQRSFVPYRYVRYVAASVILMIGVGIAFTAIHYSKKDNAASKQALLADKPTAYLELSDGRTVDLESTNNQTFKDGAANISFSQQNISYSTVEGSDKAGELRLNKLKVPKRSDYRLTLSDGTVAWLNSGSEIEFPIQFAKGSRRVKLKGEAYFEVKKSNESPFIVETERGDIEVMGTDFNISAYENDKIWHVTLVDGIVNVRRKAGILESAQLKPSQQFLIEGDAKAEIKTVDTYLYTSWREGVFVFENMPLLEIAERLERWYDVEIQFQDSISAGERYTGLFRKNESVSDIVNTILSANKVHLKHNGKQINISAKSNMH